MPTWSILIPTLSSRHDLLARLLDGLLPQAEAHPGVEVVGLHNDGEWPPGSDGIDTSRRPLMDMRQALLEDARGDWVSYADDDDLVEPDFVASVMACLGKDPDCVTFWHALSWDGVPDLRPVRTGIGISPGAQGWHEEADYYACNVNHVNPVRTTLARQAGFRALVDDCEDRGYVAALQPLLRTQEDIPRVMYHYLHRTSNCASHSLGPHAYAPRPVITSPAFRWHPLSTG